MSQAAEAADTRKSTATGEIVEIVKTIIYALLIALVIRVLLFQPFTIPSASMEPGLRQGDYIIVFKYPPDTHKDYIKRLVGLPGDRIQVRQGVLYINGAAVPRLPLGTGDASCPVGARTDVLRFREVMPNGRRYLVNDCDPGTGDADNTAIYTVPQHCYMMMGDNRDNSADSRFDPGYETTMKPGACAWDPSVDAAIAGQMGVGFVPEANLEGKAQIILLSWREGASLFKPWTWIMNARPSRFFHLLK